MKPIDAVQAAANEVGQTVDRGWANGFVKALDALGWELTERPAPFHVGRCTCPHLDHEPLARLATFPSCPVHGDQP